MENTHTFIAGKQLQCSCSPDAKYIDQTRLSFKMRMGQHQSHISGISKHAFPGGILFGRFCQFPDGLLDELIAGFCSMLHYSAEKTL